jgi:hypothetical protein
LHKLEPKELGNVDAGPIVAMLPKLIHQTKPSQLNLFHRETRLTNAGT